LRNDTAVVQLELPDGVQEETIGSILMDPTPFHSDQPVLMAGIIGGQMQMTDTLQVVRLGQMLTVHAGFVVEQVSRAEGYRELPMYRAICQATAA
jgi:hydrogenase maturation factor